MVCGGHVQSGAKYIKMAPKPRRSAWILVARCSITDASFGKPNITLCNWTANTLSAVQIDYSILC
ncbi:hypothetical protein Plhal304r1_c037g0112611 [Plasmopara halstedii]